MQKEPTIEFKPITDGLGFHPFSDGLPYAPLAPSAKRPAQKLNSGTGATVAGPSLYVPPPKTQVAPPIRVPVASAPRLPIREPRPAPTISKVSPAFLEKKPELLELQPGFLYLIRRLFAYGMDTIVNLTLCVIALSAVLWKEQLNPDSLMNLNMALLVGVFLVLFNWALITAQEVLFSTSIGKRVFGLQLSGDLSARFLRAFFFLPSVGFAGLGILWAVVDPRRRCWHDLMVGLQPTEIPSR